MNQNELSGKFMTQCRKDSEFSEEVIDTYMNLPHS